MRFYVVEREKLVEKFMCDNWKCERYRTRNGISAGEVIQTESRHVMEGRHFCSEACRDFVLREEDNIYETSSHH